MTQGSDSKQQVKPGVESQLPLGKLSEYVDTYKPQLLCPIARHLSRNDLGVLGQELPFNGVDIWNAYELSWLNAKGKPVAAMAQFYFPCESASIIESKSFKLYLNSLNQTRFEDLNQLTRTVKSDLSEVAGAAVELKVTVAEHWRAERLGELTGECLDDLDIRVEHYKPEPDLLSCVDHNDAPVQEQLYTHLFRSLCPVTAQPDWASVSIEYQGPAIKRQGLLAYLIAYRQHQGFHEQCVEQIFLDILARCKPSELTVYAHFVRRGGLDINPYRSTSMENFPSLGSPKPPYIRLPRQ
ncbi:MAG: NADPH-dependent 7-cyano-7-deazaguanine reductase QueF [Spongiibacteraceae bacterium]|nr:NADPH-dependent 7-cyano-7-deazaguanine reductase QueF [Spongiibacteraceae bacterium]MBN4055628.1 NADPH-dependent 7-cyano-7-deazaguanine reductase QueF [bacterium AH-315-K03]